MHARTKTQVADGSKIIIGSWPSPVPWRLVDAVCFGFQLSHDPPARLKIRQQYTGLQSAYKVIVRYEIAANRKRSCHDSWGRLQVSHDKKLTSQYIPVTSKQAFV